MLYFYFCTITYYGPYIRNLASPFFHTGRKLLYWRWCHNLPTWSHYHTFWRHHTSLVKFRWWPKFHVNINTGSGVMTSFIYEGLDQKSGSRNLKIWILFNVRQPERVTDTIFSDGCLLWIVAQSFKVVSIQLLPFQSYFGITNRRLPPAD